MSRWLSCAMPLAAAKSALSSWHLVSPFTPAMSQKLSTPWQRTLKLPPSEASEASSLRRVASIEALTRAA